MKTLAFRLATAVAGSSVMGLFLLATPAFAYYSGYTGGSSACSNRYDPTCIMDVWGPTNTNQFQSSGSYDNYFINSASAYTGYSSYQQPYYGSSYEPSSWMPSDSYQPSSYDYSYSEPYQSSYNNYDSYYPSYQTTPYSYQYQYQYQYSY